MLETTRRGSFVVAALIALAFSLVLFPDVVIATALLVFLALVVFEASWVTVVTRRPERWFSMHGESGESSSVARVLYPGDTTQDDIYLTKKVGGTAIIHPALTYQNLSPDVFTGQSKTTKVTVDFKTPFAGDYHSDRMGLNVIGPLKLFNRNCSLEAEFDYSVYPRTLAVAVESARILGRGGIGDFPIDQPGIGTEFYDIRGYQPGDDFKQINWKSTAKRGEFMVNERMREVGASYYLVLEAVSSSYFDRDRLATTFLGLANALADFRIRFGVVVHDGEKVKRVVKIDHPSVSLAVALKEALNFVEPNITSLGEELTSLARGTMATATKTLEGRGLVAVSELMEVGHSQRRMFYENQQVVQTITQLVRESAEEPPAVLYVSGLLTSADTLIEAAWEVHRIYGAEFMAVDPVAPWVAARDENQADELYVVHQKRLGALRSAGIEYHVGGPSAVVQRVFSSR